MIHKDFFKPTRGKIFLTLVALLFLPLVFLQYAIAIPQTDEISVIGYVFARLLGNETPSQNALMTTSGLYAVLAGLPIYTLACFFAEHRKKIHPDL